MGAIKNLFLINGSTLYCKHLPAVADAVRRAENVVWVQNDYTLPPPKATSHAESPFRKAFNERGLVPHYWTTCKPNSAKTPKSAFINWNVLGAEYGRETAKLESNAIVYYGAWRPHREAVLQRCAALVTAAGHPLAVSSTSTAYQTVPGVVLVPPWRGGTLYGALDKYGAGLYLQDKKAAQEDLCPATRFYEMLSCGLPMLFCKEAVAPLSWHGIDVSQFVIDEWDINAFLTQRGTIARQQDAWMRDFEGELRTNVTEAWNALNS